MKLDIIIPIYNEEKSIIEVINRLINLDYRNFVSSYEITIVNDCSTDNTAFVIDELAKGRDNIKILTHDINQGKGKAVRTGIKNTNGDLIVIQDADLELEPSDIIVMLEQMKLLNLEFINGSRYMPGIIRPLYSYTRYFFNKLFTKLTSILINVRITDLACGYKLFSRSIYNQISLNENRFGFEAELLIKVVRLKRTLITEVPVHYFPRNVGDGKKITNLDGLKILWAIIKYGLLRLK